MYRRHSSRPPKTSKRTLERSPSPAEEGLQRRLKGKRRRTGLKKTEAGDSAVNTGEGRNRDIIDIINSAHEAGGVAGEDEVKFVEVADEGVDKSDEDCASVTSSIASGPSVLYRTPKIQRPLLGLCSACRKLYQKAKKMKAPIKNKLLDNDPKSLTCDQWVLIKDWRPRRLPNTRGKLLTHVKVVKKRIKVNRAKQTEQCVEGESSACSRPRPFLQRNLRRCVRVPVTRGRNRNRRKRTRDDSQDPHITKQVRVHLQRISDDVFRCTDNNGLHPPSSPSGSPGFEAYSDSAESNFETVEMIPSTVTLETTEPSPVPPKQKEQKKTGGFRHLLAQLRGNSSMIVRETR